LTHFLGADHIVFPTDFPHTFTFERFVEEARGFVERRDLPPDLSRKILWDNPRRLYKIQGRGIGCQFTRVGTRELAGKD
jgi:predicted TIM-barrel fold metal-dependent hydrolase